MVNLKSRHCRRCSLLHCACEDRERGDRKYKTLFFCGFSQLCPTRHWTQQLMQKPSWNANTLESESYHTQQYKTARFWKLFICIFQCLWSCHTLTPSFLSVGQRLAVTFSCPTAVRMCVYECDCVSPVWPLVCLTVWVGASAPLEAQRECLTWTAPHSHTDIHREARRLSLHTSQQLLYAAWKAWIKTTATEQVIMWFTRSQFVFLLNTLNRNKSVSLGNFWHLL